jgi:hypothetical protein
MNEDALEISTFDGLIEVSAQGETQEVPRGFSTTVAMDEPPEPPEPYVYDDIQNAPVQLLPDEIEIPNIEPISIVRCNAVGGVDAPSDQPLVFRFGWAETTLEAVNAYADAVTHTLTFSGEPAELLSRVGPDPWESADGAGFAYNWYWYFDGVEPGHYEAIVHFTPPIPAEINADLAGTEAFGCTVRVVE